MSYPPPAGAFPPPPVTPLPAPSTGRAGALPGLAVLLLLNLVLELAILGYDLSQKGAGYLTVALGFSFADVTDAPVNFYGADTATSVALLVMIIAAFTGRGWVRAAGALLLLVNAYSSLTIESYQLIHSESRQQFGSPISHLLLNVDEIAQILIALAFAIVVAATRRPATASPVGAFPPPRSPYDFTPPPPQPAYGYPTPPQQPAPQGYPTPPQQPPAPSAPPRQP